MTLSKEALEKKIEEEQAREVMLWTDQMSLIKSERDKAWEETNKVMKRIVVGKPGDDISGAIYIRKGVQMPKAILVSLNV